MVDNQERYEAVSTMARVYEGSIMIDGNYAKVFAYIVRDHSLRVRRLESDIDSSYRGMILLRRTLLTEPPKVTQRITFGVGQHKKLGKDFFNRVDQIPGANLVYSNGEVTAYSLEE